ncbi:MAG: phosphoglycerate dehydrogenase [Dehalococcoidia bacterium]
MRVLVSDRIAQSGIELFRSHSVEVDEKLGLNQSELIEIIGDYDGLVVRSDTQVTKEILDAGINLQVVGRAGVGVDNIDIPVATEKGIVVVNAPSSNTVAAAEHTIALILSLVRHVPQAHSSMVSGRWDRKNFMGTELRGKTLGLVGLGRIGSEVARKAAPFDVKLIAYDPFVSVDYAVNAGVELVDFEYLIKTADIISLHTPLAKDSKFLVGKEQIANMKNTALLINCARGGLIDEGALLDALHAGDIGGAALDVYSEEPLNKSESYNHPRLVLTPHLGASTSEAQDGVANEVVEQMLDVMEGRTPSYAVNAPLAPAETVKEITPFIPVCVSVGQFISQLLDGQPESLEIIFHGDIAKYDTAVLRASAISGFMERSSEERVSIVNATMTAQRRGIHVTERKNEDLEEFYGNLVTIEAKSTTGSSLLSGALINGEVHIVKLGSHRVDIVPSGKPWIMIDHTDRPGMIGHIGTVTGENDINIASMQVSRENARGPALTVLGLDEEVDTEQLKAIESIDDVNRVRVAHI